MQAWWRRTSHAATIAFALATGSCANAPRDGRAAVATSTRSAPAVDGGDALSATLATALAKACPLARENDEEARTTCATNLATLSVLRDHMSEPFLWGAEPSPEGAFEDARTTRLNPLVWLKMYLSLEMFTGAYRTETVGSRTILHAETRFRSELDPGEYPYPFWHSATKWDSYQFASETLFFIDGGRVIGALRSAKQDRAQRRPVARTFDGQWGGGGGEPMEDGDGGTRRSVVLFRRLFSSTNPNVEKLDRAFRDFEAESRQYHCAGCHRPDNPAGQRQLEMLCYPNQALSARHRIVRAIEERRMPPPSASGAPGGIVDEAKRRRLLDLARAFEATAEAALQADYSLTVAVPSK
jgi:hypothetical protein